MSVSIHTSAREVTPHKPEKNDPQFVSIHTSAREVTLRICKTRLSLCCFNPHFRKGSDLLTPFILPLSCCFNPHFRKGSDVDFLSMLTTLYGFNPHFRKGSDFCYGCRYSTRTCFNPHFRKGSDSNISQKTFLVFMKHYQIHLNLLPHIPSNILSMQKHTQICLFFLVRVVR